MGVMMIGGKWTFGNTQQHAQRRSAMFRADASFMIAATIIVVVVFILGLDWK